MGEMGMAIGKMSDEEYMKIYLPEAKAAAAFLALSAQMLLVSLPKSEQDAETVEIGRHLDAIAEEAEKVCCLLRTLSDRYNKKTPEA